MNSQITLAIRMERLVESLEVLSSQGNETARQIYADFNEEYQNVNPSLDNSMDNFISKYEARYVSEVVKFDIQKL